MLSIDAVRAQIERELFGIEPKSEPATTEPKKPSSEFFTKEDCGEYLKLTWKG
jgi:hypothetical protein